MKTIIYTDKAGNQLIKDFDEKLAVLNRKKKLVRKSEFRKFVRRKQVAEAVKKTLGYKPIYKHAK